MAAMLVAVSIVLGKYLSVTAGPFRLSLENLSVILAGVLYGPLMGAAVGVVADLVGCVLVGYTINPLVTLGAGAVGLLAGAVYRAVPRWRLGRKYSDVRLMLTIMAAHLVGSCLIKSAGLMVYYAYPLPMVLLRFPLYAVTEICEFAILRLMVPLLQREL